MVKSDDLRDLHVAAFFSRKSQSAVSKAQQAEFKALMKDRVHYSAGKHRVSIPNETDNQAMMDIFERFRAFMLEKHSDCEFVRVTDRQRRAPKTKKSESSDEEPIVKTPRSKKPASPPSDDDDEPIRQKDSADAALLLRLNTAMDKLEELTGKLQLYEKTTQALTTELTECRKETSECKKSAAAAATEVVQVKSQAAVLEAKIAAMLEPKPPAPVQASPFVFRAAGPALPKPVVRSAIRPRNTLEEHRRRKAAEAAEKRQAALAAEERAARTTELARKSNLAAAEPTESEPFTQEKKRRTWVHHIVDLCKSL